MTKIERLFPIFGIAFALIYAPTMNNNWALATYHPRPGVWDWGVAPATNGPAMYWYGFVFTALLGAVVVTAIAALRLDAGLANQTYQCIRLPDGRTGNYVGNSKRPIRSFRNSENQSEVLSGPIERNTREGPSSGLSPGTSNTLTSPVRGSNRPYLLLC